MALEVRRIVTGHDSQGKAVVATDERLAGTGTAGRAGISRVDVWSTDKMPIDNSDAAAELQRKGFVVRHNYVGSGQGSVCRVVEFAPGGAKFMHRTETLDYAICLKGERRSRSATAILTKTASAPGRARTLSISKTSICCASRIRTSLTLGRVIRSNPGH